MRVIGNEMVRLSEIEIDRKQHLVDVLRSNFAWVAVDLHDRIAGASEQFTISPDNLYSNEIISGFLTEAIALRVLVLQEFPHNSQPYRALSHVIFYLQSTNQQINE